MAISLNSSSLITIYGGSGFIGRYVVQALARTGALIRVAVRRPDLAGFLQPLGGVGQIAFVQANLRDRVSVRRAAQGADALINLPGLLFQSGKQRFHTVHVEGARNVAEAARDLGARELVHVSALSAGKDARSVYGRTKAEGENAIFAAFPRAIVLRPSVVFGPEDQFLNRFAALASVSPVLPLIGGGRTPFQPVYVGDVAQAVVAALDGRGEHGAVYELGGPEILTLRQIFDLIAKCTGIKRPYLPTPFWLAKLQALFLGLLPNPALTVDQVRLLQGRSVVSEAAIRERRTLEGLGVRPQPIEAVAPQYLVRFRPHGEFSQV